MVVTSEDPFRETQMRYTGGARLTNDWYAVSQLVTLWPDTLRITSGQTGKLIYSSESERCAY